MRKIHIIGIAFAAIFAFSMVSASGASAFTLWDECSTLAPVLEFTEKSCFTLGPPSAFGWLEITTPTAVDSLLTTLKLISNLGVTVECEGSQDGTVGGTNEDEVSKILNNLEVEVTAANPVSCKVTAGEGTCGTGANVNVSPVNLPWKTLLEATGDLLEAGPNGNPGWLISCSIANECTNADTVLLVANLESELEVDLTFNPAEPEANCTFGKGKVEGTVPILLANGNGLRAM